MAQALVVTVPEGNPMLDCKAGGINAHESPLKISLDWQSAGAGTVSLAIASTYSAAMPDRRSHPQPSKIRGFLTRVDTIPDTGGTAPDMNYSITLLDVNSVDRALGNLLNRSNVTTESWQPSDPPWIDDELTLTITAAGDTNGGTVVLYLEPQR